MFDKYKPYWVKNRIVNYGLRELNSIESQAIGHLQVNVFDNFLGTPIAGAFVRVSKLTISGYYRETGIGVFLDIGFSEENGSVPIFKLPVLTNENETYNLLVQYNDFCPAYIFGVPIYPSITTTYDVYLHHHSMSNGDMHYHFILQPEIPGRETRPGLF